VSDPAPVQAPAGVDAAAFAAQLGPWSYLGSIYASEALCLLGRPAEAAAQVTPAVLEAATGGAAFEAHETAVATFGAAGPSAR